MSLTNSGLKNVMEFCGIWRVVALISAMSNHSAMLCVKEHKVTARLRSLRQPPMDAAIVATHRTVSCMTLPNVKTRRRPIQN